MKRGFRVKILTAITVLGISATVFPAQVSVPVGEVEEVLNECSRTYPALVPYPASVRMTGGGSRAEKISAVRDLSMAREEYRLSVRESGAVIVSADAAGEFYARKTLRQLRRKDGMYPCCEIEDRPRFSWRGVLLDESRHFFGKETVKRILERMSDFKLNVFHWHLTDSQGWRIQIDRYPELTRKGAVRPMPDWEKWIRDPGIGRYGPFFYTKDDIREIVAYAAERHILIVPEIEIPGHSREVVMCYPSFSCVDESVFMDMIRTPGQYDLAGAVCPGNDEVVKFFERVLDEVCALFPGGTVHIGGDECPSGNWEKCPKCRERMKANGIADASALQSWMTDHFVKYLSAKGRRVVGWDEILQGGLASGAIVMSWRGREGGIEAAKAGHEVVMCPHLYCYLDYPTGNEGDRCPYPLFCYEEKRLLPIEKVYSFDPCEGLPEECRRFVIGSQTLNWTESTWCEKDLEYKMWPRTCASAEVLWSGSGKRTFSDFSRRLRRVTDRRAGVR
jgi:hexosaminidase